jgi:hypothetical protein
VPDELSAGEIQRNFQRIDQSHAAQERRLTDLAKDMVPAILWNAEYRAILDRFARHERDADESDARMEQELRTFKASCDKASAELREELRGQIKGVRDEIKAVRDEREKRADFTWTKAIGVLSLVVVLVAALIGAWAATRGIK